MRSSRIKDTAREAARSMSARAAEQTQAQAEQVRERLVPAVEHALHSAREQAAHAAVAAGHARDWATPRIEAAVERGLHAAAPTVEAAAERVAPAVDAARDRIVEDLLPRIVEAVQTAGAASTAARVAAAESMSRSLEDAARSVADATPTARRRARRKRRARLIWWFATLAAVGAVAGALARRNVVRPTWETAPTGLASDVDPTLDATLDPVLNPALDAGVDAGLTTPTVPATLPARTADETRAIDVPGPAASEGIAAERAVTGESVERSLFEDTSPQPESPERATVDVDEASDAGSARAGTASGERSTRGRA